MTTSVTGKGLGSADGKNKGSVHQSLGVGHLIGPRVVAADTVTLSSGTAVVKLPTLGTVTDYIAMASDADATAAAVAVVMTGDTTSTTLTFTGTGAQVVHYIIVKKGLAI